MGEKINQLLSSKKLIKFLVILFVLQGLWFAVTISHSIPPDERYHYLLSDYYSKQPIQSGPVIQHQPQELLELGDVQRTPSYLYHFVLGKFLKLKHVFIRGVNSDIVVLRIVNLMLSVLALFV